MDSHMQPDDLQNPCGASREAANRIVEQQSAKGALKPCSNMPGLGISILVNQLLLGVSHQVRSDSIVCQRRMSPDSTSLLEELIAMMKLGGTQVHLQSRRVSLSLRKSQMTAEAPSHHLQKLGEG